MTDRNHRIRFCDNNLAAVEGATVTALSTLTGFPLTNLTDPLRFRTWKPEGTFVITTANRTLYINDGTDKSTTIQVGTYTGATLATNIQTRLNGGGVSTNWTCVYSSTTGKFTIDRSSGTKILRLSQTSTAAWDTLGYTGVADITALSATVVRRNHTSEYIDIDLGSTALSPTFCALLGPLGEIFSISTSATVTLKGNTSTSFTSPALTVTLTPDTHGIYQFLDDQTNTNYRYWRLEFVDRENPVGPTGFKFGHLYLGDYTTIERRNVASGFDQTLVDSSEALESELGALYFQTRLKYQVYDSVTIQYLDASDKAALEQCFYDLGKTTAFYVSFDPTQLVSTAASDLTRYVVFQDNPVFTHIKSDIYSVRMSFREVM